MSKLAISYGGFEKSRFLVPVPAIFECSICHDVIRDPRQCPSEHVYCRDCIIESLTHQSRCPECRQILHDTNLLPLSRTARFFYDKLTLRCEFKVIGCEFLGNPDQMSKHDSECDFICGILTRSMLINFQEENILLRAQNELLQFEYTKLSRQIAKLNKRIKKYKDLAKI